MLPVAFLKVAAGEKSGGLGTQARVESGCWRSWPALEKRKEVPHGKHDGGV
jgi:hypothetical protein